MTLIKYFITIIFISIVSLSFSQSVLRQKIDLDGGDYRFDDLKDIIESHTHLSFAYNVDLIDVNERYSISEGETSINKILSEVCQSKFDYKVVGKHIVLLPAEKPKKKKAFPLITIRGNIKDSKKQQLSGVVVYEVGSSTAAISDANGYRLQIRPKKESISIHYKYRDLLDTVIQLSSQSQTYNLELSSSLPEEINRLPGRSLNQISDSLGSIDDVFWVDVFVPKGDSYYLSKNSDISESSTFQLSIFPFFGNNGFESGLYVNRISLNIIAGYSRGVDGVEVSSFASICRGDVSGCQMSGFANVAGGRLHGVQTAAVSNYMVGGVSGIQLAGLSNSTRFRLNGIQLSGGFSSSMVNANAIQVSGGANYTQGCERSLQVAGGANISTGTKSKGRGGHIIQVAGGFNSDAGNIVVVQGTGGVNIAQRVAGIQVSGVSNITRRKLSGVQVSGLFNYTDKLSGFQIGLINYARTIDNGLQLGLVNIVRDGYRAFEFSASPVSVNFTYKTGGKSLYSMIDIGRGFNNTQLGYGVGLRQRFTNNFYMHFDWVSSAILSKPNTTLFAGMVYRFRLGADYRLRNNLFLSTGPSLSFYDPYEDSEIRGLKPQTFGWYFSFSI